MRNTTQVEKSTEAEDTDEADEFGDRQLRAVEEYLTVMPDGVDARGMVRVVSHTGDEYTVDVRDEACTCPDFEHRGGDENGRCKHVYRALWATGREAMPADLVEAADVEPNFGAFVETDEVRVAAADGGIVEATDDAEVLTEDDETDECEECAELSDDVPCWECYRDGATFGGDA
jgi:hypothetical protein